jgi:hypothetical protein
MQNLCASQKWQQLLDMTDAQIRETDGNWVGAYAFKGIALKHLGNSDEGTAMVSQVSDLLISRSSEKRQQFNALVSRFGT